MIIARSPLRVTLGGGGTDLPSYYEQHTGFLIAAAISKYVYITLHENFTPDLIVKYSKLERVDNAARLEHPIIREAFASLGMDDQGQVQTAAAVIPSAPLPGATIETTPASATDAVTGVTGATAPSSLPLTPALYCASLDRNFDAIHRKM